MEKRIYQGLPTDLVPLSPLQYAEIMKVTKATACNWARAYHEGKAVLPLNAEKIERMGKAWVIYVSPELLKSSK